ncbi:uncharacterized protein LOC125670914 [Ostrea edulis]|uniref:uncharacterized protein LOC125670914 n=1 Tax=Ostrea edulis TaxID=37623 RepID=UPI0024AFB30D|nr:uncharacterized protein LOC125670914 [Ostrea edulis]
MKDALESHGRVRNTLTSIIDVDMKTQPTLSGQLKFPISQFNNFIFKDSGILAFKSYSFGEHLIPSEKLEVVTKNLVDIPEAVIVASPKPSTTKARQKKSTSRLFSCCDPDGVKEFRKESQLLNHLAIGNHVYDSEEQDNILDTTKRIWVQTCTKFRSTQPTFTVETHDLEDEVVYETQAYALKQRRKSTRFSSKVKNFLFEIYDEGEKTGRKANPYTVSKQMRLEKDPEGRRLFGPSEWLTHQQIRSVFASFVVKARKSSSSSSQVKRLKLEEVNDEEDELLENIIESLHATEQQEAVQAIANELAK